MIESSCSFHQGPPLLDVLNLLSFSKSLQQSSSNFVKSTIRLLARQEDPPDQRLYGGQVGSSREDTHFDDMR